MSNTTPTLCVNCGTCIDVNEWTIEEPRCGDCAYNKRMRKLARMAGLDHNEWRKE